MLYVTILSNVKYMYIIKALRDGELLLLYE